jgi:hypothetical protein
MEPDADGPKVAKDVPKGYRLNSDDNGRIPPLICNAA